MFDIGGCGPPQPLPATAHFFAELHDAQDRKVFDTVLVVSDRNVIDAQLQDALFDCQCQTGVVATITAQDELDEQDEGGDFSPGRR